MVFVEYIIINIGDKFLVLINVIIFCVCLVVNWMKILIVFGEKGIVSVMFDVKVLGYFNKLIGIYSNV